MVYRSTVVAVHRAAGTHSWAAGVLVGSLGHTRTQHGDAASAVTEPGAQARLVQGDHMQAAENGEADVIVVVAGEDELPDTSFASQAAGLAKDHVVSALWQMAAAEDLEPEPIQHPAVGATHAPIRGSDPGCPGRDDSSQGLNE